MIDSKENKPQIHDKHQNSDPLLSHKLQAKVHQKPGAQNQFILQKSQKHSHNTLSELVFEYKLSLEYGPPLGIYILPEENNFYNWHFYLFLREGYYKDAKLKGLIKFDKTQKEIQIKEASFLTTVFHPLVELHSGNIDLSKLLMTKQLQNSHKCFTLLLRLKQMFIKEHYFLIKDSFNQQAAKIYQKNEVLFIEKVFEITIIPSDSYLYDELNQMKDGRQTDNNLQKQDQLKFLRNKIKQLCPNSSLINIEEKMVNPQTDSQESIDSKVSKLLEMLMFQ